MMKHTLFVISLFLVQLVTAQVTITAIPPGPRFTLEDLWNVTIIKTASPTRGQQFALTLNLYNDKGERLLAQTSNAFQITRNVFTVNKLSLNKIEPISTTYYQRRIENQMAKQGGLMPEGDYKVEFVLYQVGAPGGTDFMEPLIKTAYNIEAMLAYPIQLVNVPNNDTITDQYPNFTWIPPYPLPEGTVTYKVTLSEVYDGQTPLVAVRDNVPWAMKEVNNSPSLYYSASNPTLVKGKTYAWTVNAYGTKGEYVSGSETWRFIYSPEDSIIYEPEQYYVMERELKNNYFTIDSNILPIKFQEDYRVLDSISTIILFDASYDTVANEDVIPIGYEQGLNYTFISFCPEDFPFTLDDMQIYVLEITLLNRQKYYMRFINRSALGACPY